MFYHQKKNSTRRRLVCPLIFFGFLRCFSSSPKDLLRKCPEARCTGEDVRCHAMYRRSGVGRPGRRESLVCFQKAKNLFTFWVSNFQTNTAEFSEMVHFLWEKNNPIQDALCMTCFFFRKRGLLPSETPPPRGIWTSASRLW